MVVIFSNLLCACANSGFQLISLIAVPEFNCVFWPMLPAPYRNKNHCCHKETSMRLTLATQCRKLFLPFLTQPVLHILYFLCASFWSCSDIPWRCYYDPVSYKIHHLSQQSLSSVHIVSFVHINWCCHYSGLV